MGQRMLSLVTNFKTFRVSRRAIEDHFHVKLTDERIAHFPWKYAGVVELVAAINGEPYTPYLVQDILEGLIISGRWNPTVPTFTFLCSDGLLPVGYSKHTLARHFLLIRGFIEDHPDEHSITVPHSSTDISNIIDTVLGELCEDLTDSTLYALQTLTPVTDMYYLLFGLEPQPPSFVMSVLRGMTEEEKKDMRRSYGLQHRDELIDEHNEEKRLELPEGELGYCLAFEKIRDYMARCSLRDLVDLYPSFHFYDAARRTRHNALSPLRTHLLTADFTDESGILHDKRDRENLYHYVLYCVDGASRSEVCRILAMLGITAPELENEDLDPMLPYQLSKPSGRWIRKDSWDSLKTRLESQLAVPLHLFEEIIEPYVEQ